MRKPAHACIPATTAANDQLGGGWAPASPMPNGSYSFGERRLEGEPMLRRLLLIAVIAGLRAPATWAAEDPPSGAAAPPAAAPADAAADGDAMGTGSPAPAAQSGPGFAQELAD